MGILALGGEPLTPTAVPQPTPAYGLGRAYLTPYLSAAPWAHAGDPVSYPLYSVFSIVNLRLRPSVRLHTWISLFPYLA